MMMTILMIKILCVLSTYIKILYIKYYTNIINIIKYYTWRYCVYCPHTGQMQPKPWVAVGHASITTDDDDDDDNDHHHHHHHCYDDDDHFDKVKDNFVRAIQSERL